MIFRETPLQGVMLVDVQRVEDMRGSFARLWCAREFAEHGIALPVEQVNLSRNLKRSALRGLHFQVAPSREGKLVRCQRGRIFDVAVDLRPDSPTFTRYYGVSLDAATDRALYIPPGLAHGFQTLEDDSDVVYLMTDVYDPAAARGVRWNDPAFAIEWPIETPVILDRDNDYPDFDPALVSGFTGY